MSNTDSAAPAASLPSPHVAQQLLDTVALVKSLAHTEGLQGGSDSTQPPPALYLRSLYHLTALTMIPRVPL